MKTLQTRNSMVLILLALVFTLPGLAAVAFFKHPQWLGTTAVNRGELLSAPQQVSGLPDSSKWRLVLWQPKACNKDCRQQLDKLARIRLALGRRLYEVDEYLLSPQGIEAVPHQWQDVLRDQTIHVARQNPGGLLGEHARIFIASPDAHLILAYALNGKPDDIFHDLKRLLSSNQAKRG